MTNFVFHSIFPGVNVNLVGVEKRGDKSKKFQLLSNS